MKFTILLLCAGSIGFALPKAQCNEKLPFIPAPKGSGRTCPVVNGTSSVYSEDECGTKRFCRAIGAFGLNSTLFTFNPKPKWDTMEACFKDHKREPEQELLPFDFGDGFDCGNNLSTTEDCDGTLEHCKSIDEIVKFEKSRGGDRFGEDGEQMTDIRWVSTDECLKAHVPEPKDLPFLEGNPDKPCGTNGDESEETCGTEAFCNLFSADVRDGKKRQTSGSPYIWGKRQCLDAHQKKPAAAVF
ncbi:hypothetical protein ISF_07266 [Cordyceps fumosorosea ARSEF 2679]|uniref:Uncharacterized protein n=1 Tax=Cordyceps fumosorosea (strain ARSEF 2679) TaxID=1081104 RepID=A0A167PKE5_CORFA|nr:hypothetical protein ISF_07266 [Cordyceps fumosorosea ARSEF 2679]OAA56750.1 hypothetical protein ISF_07266 [Cordyceps fumosorosea ARSEF 2679]